MAEADIELTVAERLGRLLDRGLLPAGGPAEAAERLIQRLDRPARVALLGLPGAGKSSILNLLAGIIVVPETLRLPTIIVQHGTESRMLCTLADGRIKEIPGSDLAQVLTLNPAMVTLEMDVPALKVISLLEVSAGPMEADQRRSAMWASKRADILIWCTTSYLPKEQVVWDGMPDAVKDNGFLFLTKIDLLGSRDAAAGMLERVELRAGEEFRQVLSISAKQARAAMEAAGGVDRALFRDSGAAAVITTIKSRVQMARRADTDTGELLLVRHVEAGGIVARRFAEPPEPVEEPIRGPFEPPTDITAEAIAAVVLNPEPVADPLAEPEVLAKPDLKPKIEPDAKLEPEADADAAPDADADAEAEAEADPAIVIETEEFVDLHPESGADPDGPDETEVEPDARTEPESQPAAQSPKANKRFSDRIRQMPLPSETSAAPLVPLRTTWKSPTEVGAPDSKPSPVARKDQPRDAPVARSRAPEAAPDIGPDDAAIAAMMAAAVAPPTAAPRISRARAATGEATASPAAEDQPAKAQPFGAPEADPDGERRQPDPDAALPAEDQLRPGLQPRPDMPPQVKQPTDPVVRVRVDPPRASTTEDLASPRVAVMRERRPDPTATERRERPRFAARVAEAAPAPHVPAPAAPQPVSAVEQALLERAIALIAARSAELELLIDPVGKLPVDLILDHGRETTERVIDVLARGSSTELRRINGDLSEVQDLIMLMQLEKGRAPADDAMTLILQLRRDLETLSAA